MASANNRVLYRQIPPFQTPSSAIAMSDAGTASLQDKAFVNRRKYEGPMQRQISCKWGHYKAKKPMVEPSVHPPAQQCRKAVVKRPSSIFQADCGNLENGRLHYRCNKSPLLFNIRRLLLDGTELRHRNVAGTNHRIPTIAAFSHKQKTCASVNVIQKSQKTTFPSHYGKHFFFLLERKQDLPNKFH